MNRPPSARPLVDPSAMPPRLLRAVLAATLAALALPTAALAQSGPTRGPGAISAYPSPGTISAGPRDADLVPRRSARAGSGRSASAARAAAGTRPAARALGRPGRELRAAPAVPRRGAGHRADRSGDPRGAQRRFHVPDRPHPRPGDDPEPHPREHRREARVRRFRSRRDLAPPFVNVDRRSAGDRAGAAVPQPEVEEGPEAGRPDDRRRRGDSRSGSSRCPASRRRPTSARRPTRAGRSSPTGRARRARASASARWSCSTSPTASSAAIRAPNGFRPDLHEFVITPQDTAVHHHLSGRAARTCGRSRAPRRGLAVDSVIQEIDLDTGLVVFEWHSLGKIALPRRSRGRARAGARRSTTPTPTRSTLDTDGDFLMSARNTWAIYKIDRETGSIRWRLGGKRSTFKLPRGGALRVAARRAAAQRRRDHDVRQRGVPARSRKFSRALALRLDERAKTAS